MPDDSTFLWVASCRQFAASGALVGLASSPAYCSADVVTAVHLDDVSRFDPETGGEFR